MQGRSLGQRHPAPRFASHLACTHSLAKGFFVRALPPPLATMRSARLARPGGPRFACAPLASARPAALCGATEAPEGAHRARPATPLTPPMEPSMTPLAALPSQPTAPALESSRFVRRLGPHHFAHLRACAERLSVADCARHYLGIEHGHEAKTAHQEAVDAVGRGGPSTERCRLAPGGSTDPEFCGRAATVFGGVRAAGRAGDF